MSDRLKQQLSAFIDGALADTESELFARRLTAESQLRVLAERYYLIGSALRSERVVPAGFGERIARALDREPELAKPSPQARERWHKKGFAKTAAGGAIAAAVASLAILGLQAIPSGEREQVASGSVMRQTGTPIMREQPTYTVPALSTRNGPALISEPRLVNYMLRHGRVAPSIGRNDMNARIISHRIGQQPLESPTDVEPSADEFPEER